MNYKTVDYLLIEVMFILDITLVLGMPKIHNFDASLYNFEMQSELACLLKTCILSSTK